MKLTRNSPSPALSIGRAVMPTPTVDPLRFSCAPVRVTGARLLPGALDRRPELRAQALARHGKHVAGVLARGDLQIAIHRSEVVETLVLVVDQDGGRSVSLEQRPLRKLDEPGSPLGRLLRQRLGGQAAGIAGPLRELDLARPAGRDMPVDPMLLADRLEVRRDAGGRFGGAEKEHTLRAQREMEEGQDFPLRLRAQVDEHVAAGDQIEAGERRVGQQALAREHDRLAQLAHDLIAIALLGEEAGEPRRRHVGLDRVRIDAVAGERHAVRVDVGGEHLQLDVALRGRDLLQKEHGDGIGLLAGAAAGHPDAQRPIQGLPLHELRNDFLRQLVEGGRVAEEVGHIDEEVLGEQLTLARILAQDLQIVRAALQPGHRHAPLDPALQRSPLVEREIVRAARGQEIDDVCERFLGVCPGRADPCRHP